jgi:hypothetical protein
MAQEVVAETDGNRPEEFRKPIKWPPTQSAAAATNF